MCEERKVREDLSEISAHIRAAVRELKTGNTNVAIRHLETRLLVLPHAEKRHKEAAENAISELKNG